ncbi:hypothetical protein EOPP23_04415 [Endozoicomonas sp. OPT23]|uniref:type II secretion system protein N n=1 Tax=Endozoicomonas sp. OPT23 TaxID=2072845 RepID=UPI00129B17F8|nr:type II secretion system protein N [Endozoicomonas sp. OPT23]MRI32236.1 hypothetical protein [Endozoicomonas sp. OPT23]
MKRVLGLSFLALFSLTVFIVIQTPAVVVWEQVKEHFPNKVRTVQLQGIEGTLWQGSAQSALINGRQLPSISWDLEGFSPLEQSASYDLKLGHSRSSLSASGLVTLSADEVVVEDGKGRITGDALQKFSRQKLVDIDGQLKLQIENLTLVNGQCQELEGAGQLRDVSAEGRFGSLELGQGNLDLGCDKGLFLARVEQQSEDVKSSLVLNMLKGNRYRIRGSVTPGEEMEPDLKKGLSFLGKKNSSGGYQINYKGRI